jgi:hypothetical protein
MHPYGLGEMDGITRRDRTRSRQLILVGQDEEHQVERRILRFEEVLRSRFSSKKTASRGFFCGGSTWLQGRQQAQLIAGVV